jgi:hypothetical protein
MIPHAWARFGAIRWFLVFEKNANVQTRAWGSPEVSSVQGESGFSDRPQPQAARHRGIRRMDSSRTSSVERRSGRGRGRRNL